ncbi:hypothetical protein SynPROS71_02151 [Synechococcus sp. PROS-7-1]|nr:hypothetical protein SynPROS71_02151 [Synechococcus sp. PROS-7-1]QNJ06778.1 hypothetical protein SynMEDNS5_02072 [Synechococcus sp. MEDNS5]
MDQGKQPPEASERVRQSSLSSGDRSLINHGKGSEITATPLRQG